MTVDIPQRNRLLQEASEWMEALRRSDVSQHALFGRWLTRSPAHVEAFLTITALDEELRHIDPERRLKIEPTLPQQASRMTSRTKTLLFIGGGIVIAGFFLWARVPQEVAPPGITHTFACNKKSAKPIEHCEAKDDGSSYKCDCVSQAEQDRIIAEATAGRLQ